MLRFLDPTIVITNPKRISHVGECRDDLLHVPGRQIVTTTPNGTLIQMTHPIILSMKHSNGVFIRPEKIDLPISKYVQRSFTCHDGTTITYKASASGGFDCLLNNQMMSSRFRLDNAHTAIAFPTSEKDIQHARMIIDGNISCLPLALVDMIISYLTITSFMILPNFDIP